MARYSSSFFAERSVLFPVLSLLSLLAGCAEEASEEEVDVARPVKTLVVEAPEAGGERKFPARIDAVRKAELSFRVPGKVQELNVKEGVRITEGQVLAQLDTTDFKITLADRQATYDRTLKDYNRAKELVKNGFLSRTDFDKKESEFKSAEAALRQAKQDLAYTELKAPFDGLLAAATTILGLIPLLQDVFFVNMSITIMAGLGFASILTLIVIPVLYSILFRIPYARNA